MDIIRGPAYVLGDNIDTDQILSAEYMVYNPSTAQGYEKLGSLAMSGLPAGYPAFIDEKTGKTIYPVIIAGNNFGCGSSREHAPVALGASGVRAVVAPSFARIFFRNCISTGEILPVEIEKRISDTVETGDEVEIDFDKNLLTIPARDIEVAMIPVGPMADIVKAGGLFSYARQAGRIFAG